jgi:hypothetical protein
LYGDTNVSEEHTAPSSALNMEAVCSSETVSAYKFRGCYKPENQHRPLQYFVLIINFRKPLGGSAGLNYLLRPTDGVRSKDITLNRSFFYIPEHHPVLKRCCETATMMLSK